MLNFRYLLNNFHIRFPTIEKEGALQKYEEVLKNGVLTIQDYQQKNF